jgi:hypothetical protein
VRVSIPRASCLPESFRRALVADAREDSPVSDARNSTKRDEHRFATLPHPAFATQRLMKHKIMTIESVSKELTVLQFPDWQSEFEAVVCEEDIGKLRERLRASRRAIFLRLKTSTSPGTVERIALNDAIHLLRVLRREYFPFLAESGN